MKKTALVSPEALRARLKLKSFDARNEFAKKYPNADRFLKQRGTDLWKIREHSAKVLSTGALASALLLNSPADGTKYLPTPQEVVDKLRDSKTDNDFSNLTKEDLGRRVTKGLEFGEILKESLPGIVRPLGREEEKHLEQVFTESFGVKVKATLEGEHLNTTYGYIGAERHLRRFPGDNVSLHGDTPEVRKEGMAPGLGAWGYFANSKEELTPDLIEKEKWYAVVQTLYLPDWGRRQPYLKNWYKWRKVMIVNTVNGNAVIADVADSGPAAWTGKHYGGSPEVMEYLGGSRYKKGSVIVFFVDDPENKVPLGPVEFRS